MKNIITFLLSCLSVTALIAQANTHFRLDVTPVGTSETTLEYHLSGILQAAVQTPRGEAVVPVFEGGTPLQAAGMPDVSKFATALRIPGSGAMAVEVVSSTYEEFFNVAVAPSKGDLKRNVDPATVPYSYGSAYDRDDFYPGTLAELQDPFVMRNARGQAIWLFPVQYNPVTKVLRVYHDITVRVYANGLAGDNELRAKPVSASAGFEQIFEKMFVNNEAFAGSRSSGIDPEKMLVIAPDAYLDALEPLLTWKKQMGIHTTVVPLSTVGAADAATIYNVVKDFYENEGISYLLLVGDETQIDPQMRLSGEPTIPATIVLAIWMVPITCQRYLWAVLTLQRWSNCR
ncbi:MAG: hypothetical protein IPL65_16565 [Lewinellaceae bacterium]|nr:hypothetical protein [Lewinellaceae bacterium]